MIRGTVKKGKAIWRCYECGAEQPILQYMLVPKLGPMIDNEKTQNDCEAFILKHTLCKKESVQSEIQFETK